MDPLKQSSRPARAAGEASLLAQALLDDCLDGKAYDWCALRRLTALALSEDARVAAEGSRALFGILAEGLADRFEPRLADCYADLFAEVLAHAVPGLEAAGIRQRFERLRHLRPFAGRLEEVRAVCVLSRVTLGADVAICSQILNAASRRFPSARILFVGPRKNFELFAGDGRVEHLPFAYARRHGLRESAHIWGQLRAAIEEVDAILIDPDSRLSQLGLLPLASEDRTYFFESRSYGGASDESLYTLTRRWIAGVYGVEDAQPYVAPAQRFPGPAPEIAVSLGVGDNVAKRVCDPFEAELLRCLAAQGSVLIDSGLGGEERRRAQAAIAATGPSVHVWEGAFAPFASAIQQSRLYVGYDSAGQHVAAASGTPSITVFAGAVNDRMFARWNPESRGPSAVIRVGRQTPGEILKEVAQHSPMLLRKHSE